MNSRDLGISLWRYPPNYKAERGHSHREQEEAYLVTSGSGQILLDGEARDIERWDLIRVAPEVVRAFAAGSEGLELVAVGGPKPEGGDGVPGEVDWPQ
jgi:mannose-6-phosphate isomerase-like protein (cupin superfamily)